MAGQGALRRYAGKGPHDRRAEGEAALALRNKGQSIYNIARALGISEPTVYRRIDEALRSRIEPQVDEFRKQQNALLDDTATQIEDTITSCEQILATLLEQGQYDGGVDVSDMLSILNARQKAVESKLKVAERRARLNGLDAPQRVEAVVHTVDAEDLELANLIRQAEAKAAAEEQALAGGESA